VTSDGTRLLSSIGGEVVHEVWLEALTGLLRSELDRAEPGQCLRVGGLPRRLLESAVATLHAEARPDVLVGVVDQQNGPEAWRVGVHRIVECRNQEQVVVLAAIPPDVKLAAGDSVDISVFREIRTETLGRTVHISLLLALSSDVQAFAGELLRDLGRRGYEITESRGHEFLATLGNQPQEPWIVGAALGILGLIPDFALLDRSGEMAFRIGQRNLSSVESLRGGSGTLMERVFRLPVTDQDFRNDILRLVAEHGGSINDSLPAIATKEQWRHLSLDRWPFGEEVVPPGEIRIEVAPLHLPRRDDGLLLWDPGTKVAVRWSTTPPPADVPGLAAFRIELLSSDRVVVWESPLIRRGAGKTAHRSRTIRDLHDIEPGIHFFRVTAYTETADPFPIKAHRPEEGESGKAINETDDFLLLAPGDVSELSVAPARAFFVGRHTEAELLARTAAVGTARQVEAVALTEASWDNSVEAVGDIANATLRFDLRQYTVRLSQLLRQIETRILGSPAEGGRWQLDLRRRDATTVAIPLELPERFGEARARAFQAIADASLIQEGAPVVSLVDLDKASADIERYADEYRAWLESGDPEALLVDVTRVETGHIGPAVLVAPTHPLRLLWSLQHQAVARSWVAMMARESQRPLEAAQLFRETINGFGLPPLVVVNPTEGYVDAGVLPGGWGIYLLPGHRDSRSQLSLLKGRLGVRAEQHAETELPPRLLADKLEAYLRQHPYTPALVLNIINPGDGALAVEALVDLEGRLARVPRPLRYEVRLFAEDPAAQVVGEAFRDLMEPERQVSEAAARLAGPGRSFLFPKLAWSRHSTTKFVDDPAKFPAHVTIILDAFPVTLRVARIDPDDRSSFVHGLIQESPRRFVGRGDAFSWIRRAAPRACRELGTAPDRSALLAGLIGE